MRQKIQKCIQVGINIYFQRSAVRPRGNYVFLIHGVTSKKHGLYEGKYDNLQPHIFWEQLRFLQRHFTIVSLLDLFNAAAMGDVTENYCAITFDDGYKSIAEEAYPILTDLNIPATVFIISSIVDDKNYLWRDYVRIVMNEGLESEFINYCRESYPELSRQISDPRTFRGMSRLERGHSSLVFRNALIDFFHQRGKDLRFHKSKRSLRYYLTADEIRSAPKQVTFGNHTKTHPILTTLNKQEKEHEISYCQKFLAQFDNVVPILSLPSGRADEESLTIARQMGYQYVVKHSHSLSAHCDLQIGIADRLTMPKTFFDLRWLISRSHYTPSAVL